MLKSMPEDFSKRKKSQFLVLTHVEKFVESVYLLCTYVLSEWLKLVKIIFKVNRRKNPKNNLCHHETAKLAQPKQKREILRNMYSNYQIRKNSEVIFK